MLFQFFQHIRTRQARLRPGAETLSSARMATSSASVAARSPSYLLNMIARGYKVINDTETAFKNDL